MRKILCVFFCTVCFSLLSEVNSYATPVTSNDSDITIIAGPLVKPKWNFHGVLQEPGYQPHEGAIYYNKY